MQLQKNIFTLALNEEELNNNQLPTDIMLLPPSPVLGRDGRKFKYDSNTVINGWETHGQKIPIDTDHKSEWGVTAAVGWVDSIEARNNGIFGKIEWNKQGKELLEDKVYRYISPAFYSNEFGEIQYLSSVALTNHPNLKMPALNHKQKQQLKQPSINGEIMEKPLNLSLINKALNIAEDSEFDVTLNSILNLKDKVKAKVDLNNFVPKADYELVLNSKTELEAQLKQIKQEELAKEAINLVENAIKEGRIDASSKEYYLDICSNREGLAKTKEFLAKRPKLSDQIIANKEQKSTNAYSLTKEEIKFGKQMGLTEEDLINSKKELNLRQSEAR